MCYGSTSADVCSAQRVLLSKDKGVVEQVVSANTTYLIESDFDLRVNGTCDTICLPKGCILEFHGGSLNNGVIKGDDTIIKAEREQIFGDRLTIIGTWRVEEAFVEWFGAKSTTHVEHRDNSNFVQRAFDSPFPIISFGVGYYYVDKPLQLTKVKTIYMAGNESLPLEPKRTKNYKDRTLFGTVIWTDKDINVLEIRIRGLGTTSYDTHTMYMDGGTIDVSRCHNYSHTAITFYKVKDGNSNVYPYIRTCLLGPFERDNTKNTGKGIGFKEESPNGLGAFYGGVIQCYINGFATAVFHDFSQAWITNIEYHCAIDNCRNAYDFGLCGNSGGIIDGWVQAICIFDENNDEAIVKGNLRNLTISAKMWDVDMKANHYKDHQWTNQWVAKIERATEAPTIMGRCADAYEQFKNAGLALMKMPVFEPDGATFRSVRRLNYIRYVDNALLGFAGVKVDTEGCRYDGSLIEGNGAFTNNSNSARAAITLSDFSDAIGYPRLLVLTFNDYHEVNFFQDCHITSYRGDGSIVEEVREHFDGSPKYIEHAVIAYAPKQPQQVTKIVIALSNPINPQKSSCLYRLEGRFTGTMRYRQTGRMILSTTGDRPNQVTEGFQVYDRDSRRPIYWDRSGRWSDANGYTPAPTHGSFVNKPSILTMEDAGFLYYDTTNGRFIFWDGNGWKDFHDETTIKLND